MSTCPSGVDYMHLIDIARVEIETRTTRSFAERATRRLLAFFIPHPARFRLALKAVPLALPFLPLLRRLGFKELAAMIELAPKTLVAPTPKYEGPGVAATGAERRARVILLGGCVQQVLRSDINDATIRLLARRGVDVIVSHGAGCCGALVNHIGREVEAKRQARQNVDVWSKEMEKGDLDAIIINASGCGTMVKDYGHLLKDEGAYAERAAKISALTKDISEFLSAYDLGAPDRWSSLRVAYHSACSLQHGQRIHDEPRKLLRQGPSPASSRPASSRRSARPAPISSRPEISAALRSSSAGWTSPSSIRSSFSIGPMADPCRVASRACAAS
jgi:glycolate oxidase iron-sulfur subunit